MLPQGYAALQVLRVHCDPLERFFKRFGEEGMPRGYHAHPHTSMAQGSGFIISSDGYVVTNNHVVDHATEVTVVTDEGKTLSAKVIGTDKKTDLALLKITEGSDFPHVDFAKADGSRNDELDQVSALAWIARDLAEELMINTRK